jgi:hypothetical protein
VPALLVEPPLPPPIEIKDVKPDPEIDELPPLVDVLAVLVPPAPTVIV